MARAYSDEVRSAALEAYTASRSFSAAARSAGASVAAVREWAIKAGLYEARGLGAPVAAAAIVNVAAALAAGDSPESIAAGLRGGDTARWGEVAAAVVDSADLTPPACERWRWGEVLAAAAAGAPLEIAEAAGGLPIGTLAGLAESPSPALQRLGVIVRIAQAGAAKSLLSQIRASRGGGGGAAWVLAHQGWRCYSTDHNVNLTIGGLHEMPDDEILDIVKASFDGDTYNGDEIAPLDEILGGKESE